MKSALLLLVFSIGSFAQSLAVISPANGAVVTYGFPLSAAPTSLPSMTQGKGYVDGRLECVVNRPTHGVWQCPEGMHNPTFSDERAATTYWEAYDSKGTLLATSSTNTFRVNNSGVNTATTFNFGGVVTNGATISGTGTIATGINATVAGLTYSTTVDGQVSFEPNQFAPMIPTNLTTGQFTISVIDGHTGSGPLSIFCSYLYGGGCISPVYPSPLAQGGPYYLIVDGPASPNGMLVRLATSLMNAKAGVAVAPLTATGVAANSYLTILYTSGSKWVTTGSLTTTATVDTTQGWMDGLHRVEQTIQSGTSVGLTGTFTFTYPTAVNLTTGIVTSTNYPLAQDEPVTLTYSGTPPPELPVATTFYPQVQSSNGANTFCFSATAGGACIAPLTSEASETGTVHFAIPSTFWLTGNTRTYGIDINEFTTANGAVPCSLRAKYSKIVGIAGDTFTLAPYVQNCDGSTTAVSTSDVYFATADSTRATVNSGGVVTLGSTVGHALVMMVDHNITRIVNGTARDGQLIDVEVRADRITYKHLSSGCGMLSTYNPACSSFATTPFGGNWLVNSKSPYLGKYVSNAFTSMQGLWQDNFMTKQYLQNSSITTYAQWFTNIWSNAGFFNSLPYITSQNTIAAAHGGSLRSYGSSLSVCGNYNAWYLTQTLFVQQIYAQQNNDTPNMLGFEVCDEMSTRFGNLSKPRGDIGSGQDGIGNTTLGGQPAGLSSFVTTGGVTTVNWRTWPYMFFGGQASAIIQISGATSMNCTWLNGPYIGNQLSNPVYSPDNPIAQFLVSFQLTGLNPVDGTCDASSDPGIKVTQNSEGADYSQNGASSLGNPCTSNCVAKPPGCTTSCFPPTWSNAYWSPNLLSVVCGAPASLPSNTCIINWTGIPLTDGQNIRLLAFTTAGLNGYWHYTTVNANSGTFKVSSVADGTYNVSSDPNATIDGIANFPDTFYNAMMHTYADSLNSGGTTATHIPQGGSLTGGSQSGGYEHIGWQGTSSSTDFAMENQTFVQYDRYGPLNHTPRDFYRAILNNPYVDGLMHVNYMPDDKPYVYEADDASGCAKYVATLDCRTAQVPGDKYYTGGASTFGGTAFISSLAPFVMVNGVGSRLYQYGGFSQVPNCNGVTLCIGAEQTSPDQNENIPEAWLGAVMANVGMIHEDKYFLQPLLSCPDLYIGPGPYTRIECQAHTSSYGNAMIVENFSEETVTVPSIDLSIINPGGAGGPMRKDTLNRWGNRIDSLTPSTVADTNVVMPPGSGIIYVSQVAGATDDLLTLNVGLKPDAIASHTNSVVQVAQDSHQWNIGTFQPFDGGTGTSVNIKVLPHGVPVYYRVCTTKTDGSELYCGGEQTIASQ